MDFDFPDEMKMLRDAARKLLRAKCPTAVPRRILEQGGAYDRDLWREIAALGWIGAAVPESLGGGDLGHLALCIVAEEIGRAIAPLPFASSVYGAIEALSLFAGEAQRADHLPRLASGKAVGTLALAERPGAFLPERIETRFADGRLTGVKVAVPDGEVADLAIVAAREPRRGPVLCLVALDAAGVTRTPVASFDPTRPHARVSFDNARAELLPDCRGTADIRRLLDRAAIMMAFEQLGGAETALAMATAHARERYAFGRPIGSFQAIKHKLADMYVAVELARSNAYYGAWALATDAAELPMAAACARIAASDAGWITAKENVQTHGGMGYTWEGDAHLFYRRAKLLGLALGSTSEWKRRLAGELASRNAALVTAPQAGA